MTAPSLRLSLPAARRRNVSQGNPEIADGSVQPTPVAALFVSAGGVYSGLPGIDAWGLERDARLYNGPWPVVVHPPCQRWGRFWHGSTRKPHQYKLGADDGCFAAALAAVRTWGGVLEHPADSHAWAHFGLKAPSRDGGWIAADFDGGWTCCVEQGHYGHIARKATWLYACKVDLPSLRWGRSPQRIHPVALARYGYEKARRIGMMAMVGGKDKTLIREATPIEFRDVLISIARTASDRVAASEQMANAVCANAAFLPRDIGETRGAAVLPDRRRPLSSLFVHATDENTECVQ